MKTLKVSTYKIQIGSTQGTNWDNAGSLRIRKLQETMLDTSYT